MEGDVRAMMSVRVVHCRGLRLVILDAFMVNKQCLPQCMACPMGLLAEVWTADQLLWGKAAD